MLYPVSKFLHLKNLLQFLKERESEISMALGDEIDWFSANVASGMRIARFVPDIFDESSLESHFEWMHEKTMLLKNVLSPLVLEYKTTSSSEQ